MRVVPPTRARAALAAVTAISAIGLGSCSSVDEPIKNAAEKPVELARYLPKDTQLVETVDVIKARDELGLPEDANAAPTGNKIGRPGSPEGDLFQVTARAYPVLIDAYQSNFDAKQSAHLDGTQIKAAADGGTVVIVSTAESFDDVAEKLKLTGYDFKPQENLYEAGPKVPETGWPMVADAGEGRIVFGQDKQVTKEVLKRIAEDAEPGPAAEALQPANGTVRLAATKGPPKSCVTGFAVAHKATGEGASVALTIAGDKPDPDRFDPKAFRGIDIGTPTVLVDALIIPYSTKKPLRDGIDPIGQVISVSGEVEIKSTGREIGPQRLVPPPFKSYDCP